ncbi:hypothetical protein J3U68_04085 [Snodgrassella sp. B3882]|uniref:hypothetical protein n=1 Tax=Snodgrassella sp. B3882 TaxID=2818037 RepID=UPI002269DDC0|nr:hypothetical protein [Snodgrassella sp. B3882]MCX8744592.1 hypothetical protein [Snodgrassella sp. B3882]
MQEIRYLIKTAGLTYESFNVKQNINHVFYEEARLPSTPKVVSDALIDKMREDSSKIPNPANVSDIK